VFCSVRILNDIIVFSSTIFIFDLIFVNVEKCRFLVFALMEEAEGFTVLVHVFPQEASTFPLRIIHSDSEYELLVPIYISSSYQLNLISCLSRIHNVFYDDQVKRGNMSNKMEK